MSDRDKAVLEYATEPKGPGRVGRQLANLAAAFLVIGYGSLFFVMAGWDFLFYGHKGMDTFIAVASPVSLLLALILSIIAHRFDGLHRRRNKLVLLLASLTLAVEIVALHVLSEC